MKNRVVITGIGVVSSIGIGKDAFWDSLIKGKSGISPVASFDTSNHFTKNGGEVKNFNAAEFIRKENIVSISRATQFALTASALAIKDSCLNLSNESPALIGICFGTTLGAVQTVEILDELIIKQNNKFNIPKELFFKIPTHSTPSSISAEIGSQGPNIMFSTACSAGNYAIGYGYDLIRLEKTKIMIVGGSDPFSKVAFTGFNQFSAIAPEKCQPFDKNRKGMMVAEGAGVLILESLDHALVRGATIYAEIPGYGLSCDARHMTNPSVKEISVCMRKAMKEAGITIADVDYISAHGTGTVANDRTECAAIREVFGERSTQIPISSIKSMLGHTMGAASAIEAITCALAIKNDIIPPTINYETPDPECDIDCVPNEARKHVVNIAMNNSYAFGGNNASLILKKFSNH